MEDQARAIKAVVVESQRLKKLEERLILERDKLHEYNLTHDQVPSKIAEELLNKILSGAPKSEGT